MEVDNQLIEGNECLFNNMNMLLDIPPLDIKWVLSARIKNRI